MTRDEIIRMASDVGAFTDVDGVLFTPQELERFCALAVEQAADKEREACAQACDLEAATWPYPSHGNAALTIAATAIRARQETK